LKAFIDAASKVFNKCSMMIQAKAADTSDR
jgi:hypothetical protein